MRVWPSGIGETTGDGLVLSAYLATKTNVEVVFVDFASGDDANAGRDRRAPKKTLSAGVTAAIGGDGIVVLLPTHDETLTAVQTLSSAGLTIVGAGTSGGKPTAKLRMNHANQAIFAITGVGVEIRNVMFPENVQANAGSKITIGEVYARLIGCYFEQGANDNGSAFDIVAGGSYCELRDVSIVSTTTAASNLSGFGARVMASVNGPWGDGLVLDGGAAGFLQNVGWSDTGGPTGLFMERLSQLRGADFQTGASGWIQTMTATGGARVGD